MKTSKITLCFLLFLYSCAYSTELQIWRESDSCIKKKNITKSEIISAVKDSIVSLEVSTLTSNHYRPYQLPVENRITGSGFFINENGYILTNAHVLGGVKVIKNELVTMRPNKIYLSTQKAGYEKFEVDIIGIFEKGDIALLKLKEKDKFLQRHDNKITSLSFADSENLTVGEDILSLGYPLNKKNLTVTEGIISGFTKYVGRSYQSIQTDSALNSGNSGGPSLDKNGSVVGINRAIEKNAQNINYIIPINVVKTVLPQLLETGEAHFPSMEMWWEFNNEHTVRYLKGPKNKGVVIHHVEPNGTADKAGLRRLDILTKIGDIDIDFYGIGSKTDEQGVRKEIEPFVSYINRYAVDNDIAMQYYRNGIKYDKIITLNKALELPVKYQTMRDRPDYEIWGGMVVQQLNRDIIFRFKLHEFYNFREHYSPKLVITHVFGDSQAHKTRLVGDGDVVHKINNNEVGTLQELREILKSTKNKKYLTMEFFNKIFVALDVDAVEKDEPMLKEKYRYTSNRPKQN